MRTNRTGLTPVWRPATSQSGQRLRWLTVLLLLSSVGVPPLADAAVPAPNYTMPADTATESGTFRALTYNIAGLPAVLSSAKTDRPSSTTTIGTRLEPYDVVNVQEDFNYHAFLYAAAAHQYRTPTSGGAGFGSGLNTLSKFPLEGPTRVTWESCWIGSGDCLTPKGFTFTRVHPADGVIIDVYNLHTDAGSEAHDMTARSANLDQLTRFIAARSAGNAVVVMGDTNSRYTRAGDAIAEFAAANGLRDAWVDLVRDNEPPAKGEPALLCDDTAPTVDCETVDKVFYRSGDQVTLGATAYRNAHTEFATEASIPLSDHFPIAVDFAWSCIGTCLSGNDTGPIGAEGMGSTTRSGSTGL